MDKNMRIIVGCDLAGYDFKEEFISILRSKGYNISDAGCNSSDEGEYTLYGRIVGEKVVSGEFDRGVVICGTGNGITMAANKVKGVRAALCHNQMTALMSREHNNANVLGLSAWCLSMEDAIKIAEIWFFGKFAGGRHEKRVQALADIENNR